MRRHKLRDKIRLLWNADPERSGRRLIVFTRYPEPGKTKTRLIPVLGQEGAAELSRRMTEHTLRRVRTFLASHPVSLRIRYDGGSEEGLRQWLGADLRPVPQGEGDLGKRMHLACAESFEQGMKQVVLVGTDIPGIRPAHLESAFAALKHKDVVIGPARDGGYYLIGLSRPAPDLFDRIPWGTGDVLQRTLDAAAASNRRVSLLDPLEDVDRPEDIPVWEQEVRDEGLSGEPKTLSIIIPTLDEADRIESALTRTEGIPSVTERIVVDGGSRDGTGERARACGAKVIVSAPMRSTQMNAGARAAEGTVLLFLHADTRLPPGFEHLVLEILDRPDTVAGAFRLGIDGHFPGLRVIEKLADFRSICMGMPYGDQAIFIAADRFHRAGGFPEIPIMEDFALMRRLRSQGRIGIARTAVSTSSRRYDEYGFWRTTLINQLMILAFLLGISPARLARWYRSGLRFHDMSRR
jgi:rSAM/selenodomain-associated transferase 2/rSAM/selenodomain-associated transferase 1